MRLLGVILQDDLSWKANTKSIVKRAYTRMVILRKLVEFNVNTNDMVNIYVLFIRSVLEQSSVVWSSSVTCDEQLSLERAQKVALRIIFQEKYISYENALEISKLPTMKTRYEILLSRFAKKLVKNENTKDMLPLNKPNNWSRERERFVVPLARKERYYKSAIPTMATMMNKQFNEKQKKT